MTEPSRAGVRPEIFDAIMALVNADGDAGMLAEEMVEAGRLPDSQLHALFEWNDAIGGQEHRLEQARAVIRRCKLVYTDNAGQKRVVRAFINLPIAPSGPTTARNVIPLNIISADHNDDGDDEDDLKGDQPGRPYFYIQHVVEHPVEMRTMLEEAHDALTRIRNRFSALTAFAEIFSQIDAWKFPE